MIDCCKTPAEPTKTGNRFLCTQCGREGQPVDRTTVQALLKPEALGEVNGSQYMFCETPNCPVVYCAADGTRLKKEQVRVRVALKETENPLPVCYCFGVTERMIREEVQRTGRSSASARIRAEVKEGNCRCEVENPSGRCCLEHVIRAEKQATAEIKGAASPAKSAMASSSAGGLLAAFLASICCIGPFVFAALGVGVGATGFLANTAGVLKALLPYRPLFIGLTMILLGCSFYFAYRKPAVGDVSCHACVPASGVRSNRWLLWIIAGLAVALVLAPYWLELVTGS
jgi:mercuric ion transport protein